MAKMPSKARRVVQRAALVLAALAALVTYTLVPLTGRGPIGIATLAAGAAAYALVRTLTGWGWGRLSRAASSSRTATRG